MYSSNSLSVTQMHISPVLETISTNDAQTDVQDVPVDGESLIRRLALLLIYQCMSVPTSGTTILSGHHSLHVHH